MIVFIILIILLAVLASCLAFILYGRKNYGLLESCGIPVVKRSWFLGSVPEFHKEIQQLEDVKRFQKYGPVWGVYEGQEPQIHIADPELNRLIFVKDFEYFHDRKPMDFGSDLFNEILDYLPGEKWKTVRQLLTPMLTTSKLKFMSKTIASSAKEFAEDLRQECDDGRLKIDCRSRITTWLIDMFGRTTLNVRMADAKNPNNEIAVAFRTVMGEKTTFNWIYSLSLTFPILKRFAPTFDSGPADIIEKTFRYLLDSRRKTGDKTNADFVDLLNDLIDRTPSAEFKRLKITQDTIISQAVNIFLKGYDTSGTTSTLLLYYLATNPDIQRTLQKEVDKIFEKCNNEINHESISDEETPYLTACINEALRLGPPLYRPERLCMKDWSRDNIKIKRNTTVFLCNWALHRNALYFPEPDVFKPERFLPENKKLIDPYAYAPFGFGPRGCIGIRFAYESIKMLFIHLLRNFDVNTRDDTDLQYKPGQKVVVAFKPLYFDLVDRQQN